MENMPDYETMYKKLNNAISNAILILQGAQEKTEEMLIEKIELDE